MNLPLDPGWHGALSSASTLNDTAFAGRHVAVTRGLSAIGRAQAAAFSAAGAQVTLLDLPALLANGREFTSDLPGTRFFGVDLDTMTDVQAAASHLVTGDPIDVLVNNAAPRSKLSFGQLSMDDFELDINASCTATFLMARTIATGMKPRGRGSIVNLCAATRPGEWSVPGTNAALNGAIMGLTRSLARELGIHGIRVNAVSTGAVTCHSEIRIFGDRLAEYDSWVIRNQCLKRRIRAEDVADLVMFLASDHSAMITGQNFVLDGGW